jgi:hypothetical protein
MIEDDENRDDMEGLDPEAAADEDSDPAQAFEALRQTVESLAGNLTREMTNIRKGVELALDRFEEIGPAADYRPEFGKVVQQLAAVAEHLHGVEQSPVLRNGPEHYARALERCGEGLVKTAVQQLERQASDLERAGRNLASYTQSAYDRKSQDFRMWTAGLVGLVLGILLILLLPRFLPFSADSHVASLVMGFDRVSAGYAMIGADDPLEVEKMKWGGRFYNASGGEISVCLETARQTGKDQKCTITVPAPE